MSEATITTITVAMIVAIPPTIAALAGWKQSRSNARKADEIHILVNSNLTAVKTDLAIANEHIKELQELVAKLTGR